MKKAIGILIFIIALVACFPSKRTAGTSFENYLNSGLARLQEKNYFVARQEFFRALNLNPKSARVLNLIGLTYFREQDYDLAESYFQRAIKADPGFTLAYLNLGAVYAMKQLYSRSREYYEKALQLDSRLTSAYYSLGAVCFQMGDEQAALNYLSRGLELDPEFLEKHQDNLSGLPMRGTSLAELNFSFARLYASRQDVDRVVHYLEKARQAGFKDWKRIEAEPEFEKIRDHPAIREFLKEN
ncbi:MAG: tetratricopeptide repeat protein [Candidatus Saccharicenans sp.]|nr:tetratricopeptide repeat protein [Candidatus Saccharicenans sp.]